MEKELISVIIPCYNSEKWIKECLQSVINQVYKNLEIIVVDDGSTDNTAQIIRNFTDNRLKYFYKKNEGASATRNFGIEQSKGNWISFLDSDDYWLPDKIEKQIQLTFSGYDFIYCDFNKIDENGNLIDNSIDINPVLYNNQIKKMLLNTNKIAGGSSALLNKKIIKTIGLFNTHIILGEDWEYWARAAWANFKFGYINEKLIYIRQNTLSVQNTSSIKLWKNSTEAVFKSFLKFPNINNKYKAIIYKNLALNSYKFGGSFNEIVRYYFNAITYKKSYVLNFKIIFMLIKYLPRKIINYIKKSYNASKCHNVRL